MNVALNSTALNKLSIVAVKKNRIIMNFTSKKSIPQKSWDKLIGGLGIGLPKGDKSPEPTSALGFGMPPGDDDPV